MATSSVTEDFVRQFHSVSGTTIGERRKNIFKLCVSYSNEIIDLNNLAPHNQLEEAFKIDILIYFKNINGLVEVFKTENISLIKRVLRINWLWSSFDKNLIEEIFPRISYSSKLKIINKLATHLKNTQQADAVFAVVNENYGMYLASKLLPCCSFSVISQNFTRNIRKHLSVRQILLIIRKHPDLAKLLLEHKTSDLINHNCIFKQFIQNHLELFEKLFATVRRYNMKLGWRATNKFVVSNKEIVVEKAPYFYEYLHKKQVVKSIGTKFPQFYTKMFPKTYEEFKQSISLLLDLMKERNISNKFEFFASAYRTAYGIDFLESDTIDLRIFELMNKEQRLQISERLNIPSIVSVCLRATSESLPILQKLTGLSSNTCRRAEMVGNMVETCRINTDNKALLEVCKYVYKHHSSDDVSVFLSFINAIEKGYCLTEFNEEIWFFLGKVLKVVLTRDTMWFQYSKCLYAYIYFLFTNNKPLKPIIRLLAKKHIELIHLVSYNRGFKIPLEFEKQYLIELGEVLPEVYKDKELNIWYVNYLASSLKWNKKYPDNMLPVFDNKEAIRSLLEEWQSETYNHSCALVMLQILCLKQFSEKSFWASTYFKKKVYSDMTVLEWLIKYEPLIVYENIDSITTWILDMYYTQVYGFFFTMSRNYTHIGLPQTITQILVKVITSTDESEPRKKNALTGLSYIASDPQEFITLLTPYYPVDKTEPDTTTYVMQQNMSRSLGNVIPPSSMLQSVLEFSKGDYTKFIRRSMYLIAFTVSEDKLNPFFTELNNLAVSVRKHAIYLSFRVLDRNSIYNTVRRNLSDKNVSIRKILLRSIFNFFIKNPDEFVWNMLKESIQNVDIDDEEALEVIVQLEKVPINYMMCYIEFITTFVILDDNVANAIPDSVYTTFESDFITDLISINSCTDVFIYKSLINSTSDALQLKILEMVFKQRLDLDTSATFLQQCAGFFIANHYYNVTLLHKCTELLKELQPHEKYLEDSMYLEMCKIYSEFHINQKSISKLAESLVIASEAFVTRYKTVLFYKFSKVVDLFIKTYFENEDLLMLIQNIIEFSHYEYSIKMAVSLLPHIPVTRPNSKLIFNRIVEILQLNQRPSVTISLSVYLNAIMPHRNIIENQLKSETRSNKNVCHFYNPYYESGYANAVLTFE